MSAEYIYFLNLRESQFFASLDALYHVFSKGQEEKWEIWWNYAKSISAKEILKTQKQMINFLNQVESVKMYTPAVDSGGIIIGNQMSFIILFHSGEKNFFDLVG